MLYLLGTPSQPASSSGTPIGSLALTSHSTTKSCLTSRATRAELLGWEIRVTATFPLLSSSTLPGAFVLTVPVKFGDVIYRAKTSQHCTHMHVNVLFLSSNLFALSVAMPTHGMRARCWAVTQSLIDTCTPSCYPRGCQHRQIMNWPHLCPTHLCLTLPPQISAGWLALAGFLGRDRKAGWGKRNMTVLESIQRGSPTSC